MLIGMQQKSREYLRNANKVNLQLEEYHLNVAPKKKEEDHQSGTQHLIDTEKKYLYFKCGRIKPNCGRAKCCKYTKKEDRTDINLQELIDQKFKELKGAKCQQPKEEEVEGTLCVINTQMVNMNDVPKQDDMLQDEDSYDENILLSWVVRIDVGNKEFLVNYTENKVFN